MPPDPMLALDMPDSQAVLDLAIGISPLAVRQALEEIAGTLRDKGVSAPVLDRIVLVCAEALNNVVEHSGLDAGDPPIQLQLTLDAPWHLQVRDAGRSLPAALLTRPRMACTAPDCAKADLPEGGFGWMMINALSDRLDYVRRPGANCLEITIRD